MGAIAEFEKRLQGFCDFSWYLAPSSSKESESQLIERQFKADDVIWLLDERGKALNNVQLAQQIDACQNQSVKRLIIIIGGAYGVTQSIFDRSDKVISLSPLVFPHQIVRLLVVEQLYRSFSILADGKYHHQ